MVLATEVRDIVKSLKSSNSDDEIAHIIDCDVDSVKSCVNECELQEKLQVKPPFTRHEIGRPKVLESRKLVEQLLSDHPWYNSIDLQRELFSRFGIEVSRRTLQRRISEIRSKKLPRGKGGLSAEVRKRRLDWATEHKDWTVRDWRNIFNMYDLKLIDSEPPKDIFVDTLMGPEGSKCKDLNLLEQLMDIIGPSIKSRSPKNVYEFRAVLYDVWHSDQKMVDKIEHLYESMPFRIAAVLQNGGKETDF